MKKTRILKLLSFALCIVLIAAMALFAGCNDNTTTPDESSTKNFTFVVVDTDSNETKFEISTTKTIVGDALLDEGLIAGEDSQYGLYVKTVNGTTLDFDTDGMYWAFYVNGQYAMSGVDTTEIKDGETYMFKAEK